jgi:HD superfamily phosphohydrolase YqeK
MSFSTTQTEKLKASVSKRLTEGRFLHTLGVANAAVRLAEYCLPDYIRYAEAAGLLHDISKELSFDENIALLKSEGIALDSEDYESPAIIHSFTAPIVIKRDFSDFAKEEILSAVYNHTIVLSTLNFMTSNSIRITNSLTLQ